MFRDSLLESSPVERKGKRWPMAAAFTLETIVAIVLVAAPLLSTGVIPLSARPPVFTPPARQMPLERPRPMPVRDTIGHGTSGTPPRLVVVLVNDNPNAIHFGPRAQTTNDPAEAHSGGSYTTSGDLPENLFAGGNNTVAGPQTRRIVSVLSEAQLVNRVEPVYPKLAVAAGVQGQVKLHAIIARDGRVVSLNVTSGHPLLAQAAEDAVRQWRYRPYYLNGVAVEVETFITVNFKREGR